MLNKKNNNKISIGACSTSGTYLLPALLAKYGIDHPDINLELLVENSASVLDLLTEDKVDFAISGNGFTLDDAELISIPIFNDEIILVLSQKHPLAQYNQIFISHLENEVFIMREKGSSTREIFEKEFRKKGLGIKIGMELNCQEAINRFVASGMGLSVLPSNALKPMRQSKNLKASRIEDSDCNIIFTLYSKKERALNSTINHLIEYLVTRCKKIQ